MMSTAFRRDVRGVIADAVQFLADSESISDTVPAVAAGETFDGTWPFTARYSTAPGFRLHYVDEGAGPETFLLLHGEPTWGYLYRQQIPVWARHGRVIAVDHMGFGKSAAPQDRTYWLQDHIDNLERFVLAENLRDLTLVMHDFGGPAGMGLAIRHPDRIRRIVSVSGPTPLGQPDLLDRLVTNAGDAAWFQWIAKAEQDGVLEDVLGQLDYNMLSTLKLNGFERNEIITEAWLNAYRAPFPTPAHTAGAIGWAKGFATDTHAFENPDIAAKAALAAKPALALWGTADRTLHAKHFLPLFEQAFPNGTIHRLAGAGHYSLEDAPGETARRVAQFVST
jgi:haloalkane dehalogenase